MSKHFAWLVFLLAVTASGRDKTENWLEVHSQHFVVITDGNEKQGRHTADQLERMRSVFHTLFPKMQVDPPSPIVVIAVKNEKNFRALEPEAYLAKGSLELAGLFLRAPDKNYILLRLDAAGEHPYATVYHEYTHLLSSKGEESLPLWLSEGLAEFYENTDILEKEVVLGQASQGNILLLRENRLIPLPTLFAIDHTSPYYHEENKGSIFYAESWVMTHYLMVTGRQQNKDPLGDYAKLVSQGIDGVTAASRAFGDLKQLQTNLDRYVHQSSFSAFKMPGSSDVDDNTFKVQPLPLAQADAMRADFLAYNERAKDARALLEEVLHDDPGNVQAHETMGHLEFRQSNLEEAQKWYAQAIKLDSQSYLANFYFASIAMNRGQTGPDIDSQIEASLQKAIKLNPSFAPSYDQLAVFYAMSRKNLDQAHMLTLQAVQLDPGSLNFRMNAANVLLTMRRETDAIAVLQNALKLARTPQETLELRNRIAMAQESQSARARVEEENREVREAMKAEADSMQAPAAVDESTEAAKPEESLDGPPRTVTGTIKNVRCLLPAVLDLDVVADGGKTVALHSGNYYRLQFIALGFAPDSDLRPCSDLEGMHAKVEYVESKSIESKAGGLTSIELHK
jgi:Tfp pilus assembly protein PilF